MNIEVFVCDMVLLCRQRLCTIQYKKAEVIYSRYCMILGEATVFDHLLCSVVSFYIKTGPHQTADTQRQ